MDIFQLGLVITFCQNLQSRVFQDIANLKRFIEIYRNLRDWTRNYNLQSVSASSTCKHYTCVQICSNFSCHVKTDVTSSLSSNFIQMSESHPVPGTSHGQPLIFQVKLCNFSYLPLGSQKIPSQVVSRRIYIFQLDILKIGHSLIKHVALSVDSTSADSYMSQAISQCFSLFLLIKKNTSTE